MCKLAYADQKIVSLLCPLNWTVFSYRSVANAVGLAACSINSGHTFDFADSVWENLGCILYRLQKYVAPNALSAYCDFCAM